MNYINPIGYQPTQFYYPQKPNSGRIWVQGEAGAKSYLVAPNSTVDLWDSEKQVIYIKSADASGVPSMTAVDYTFRDNTPQQAPDFVTHDELNQLKSYIDGKFSEIGGGTDDE